MLYVSETCAATKSQRLNTVRFYSSLISSSIRDRGRMSLRAVIQGPRFFPPYDSAPLQGLSAPSLQAAGTERGCGAWHRPFPRPGLEATLCCQDLVTWPHHTTRKAGKCHPGTRGKRDRVWGARTHAEQAPCTRQSKGSFQPWGGLGQRSLGPAEHNAPDGDLLGWPSVSVLPSTQDMVPHGAFPSPVTFPGIHLRDKGTDQTNPAFLCPQCLPSTKWEEK